MTAEQELILQNQLRCLLLFYISKYFYMKNRFYAYLLLLCIVTANAGCTGSNGNNKRDTTLTSGGDVSSKDTLLDRGKAGDTVKEDTVSKKAKSVKK